MVALGASLDLLFNSNGGHTSIKRIGFWEHRGNPRELWFVEALHNGREMGSDPSRDTNDVASISSRCHRGSDPFSLPLCKAPRTLPGWILACVSIPRVRKKRVPLANLLAPLRGAEASVLQQHSGFANLSAQNVRLRLQVAG